MASIRELLKQRDVQDRRANDAEARGFAATAERARQEAERLEREIADASDGTWASGAHP